MITSRLADAALTIRPIAPTDHDVLWAMLEPVIRAGETYALDRDMSRDDAIALWCAPAKQSLLALIDGVPAGTYYLAPNQRGGGAHVGNCGYIVHPDHVGRGLAGRMAADSIMRAAQAGYRALQFNFVVGSNRAAIAAWERAGFAIVGTLPGAFAHPRLGYVEAHVMYRALP